MCIRDRYIVEVFEPKVKENTEYIGFTGKWWRKYISKTLYKKIQEYIKKHPNRELVFVRKARKSHVYYWLNGFRSYLKKAYEKIGIREEYFFKRPIHALRHTGAHRLLKLTNYNYSLVAEIGGWTDEKTLKDCYGKIPSEIIIDIVKKIECLS